MTKKAKTTKAAKNEEIAFEDAMAQLEDVVRRLEQGDVALEESLVAFEKGVGLVRVLHARLESVQAKIEELTRGDDELATKPFEPE